MFTNNGTALMLTPMVLEMLLALGFSAGSALAFVIAAGFIAGTASLPLVISNLVNLISADFFGISFVEYALVMVVVNLVSVAASLAVLVLLFRKQIPASYSAAKLREPRDAIKDRAVFRAAWWVLALLRQSGHFAVVACPGPQGNAHHLGQYFRIGILITLPVLLVTLLALAGWLSLIR